MSGFDPTADLGLDPALTTKTADQPTPPTPPPQDLGLDPVLTGETDPLGPLKQSWAIGKSRNPDEYAKTLKTAKSLNLPADLIEAAPDVAAQLVSHTEFDPAGMALHHPALAAWLMDPKNASIAHDDVPSLSALDFVFQALPKAVGQGIASAESGLRKAAGAANLSILASPGAALDFNFLHPSIPDFAGANDAAIAALDKKASEPVDESTWWKKALVETARFSPVLGASIAGSAVAGPEVGAAGLAGYFGITGYGDSKYKMAAFRDENGSPIPESTQQIASIWVGVVDAALGFVDFKALQQVLPGAKGIVQDAAVKSVGELLTRPTMLAVAKSRLKDFLIGSGTAGGVSGLMTATQIIADKLAVLASGQNVDLPTLKQNASSIAESVYTGVLIGATTGAGGLAYNLPSDYAATQRAKQAQAAFVNLGKAVADTKVSSRAPEQLGELATASAEAGQAPEHVFISGEAFNTLFQKRDLPPEEAARQLGVSKEYAEAATTGGDVAIPFSTYVEKIAGTPLNDEFAQNARFDPGDPTVAELQGAPTVPPVEDVAGEAPSGEAVHKDIKDQLVAAGVPEDQADHQASVYQAFFSTTAGKTGQTAEALHASFPLSIVREETPTDAAALNQGEEKPLGSYTVTTSGATIRLSASDNLSTFLHETGHHFFRILGDLARADGAPESLKRDYQAIRDYVGAKTSKPGVLSAIKEAVGAGDKALTREQHEQLADAWLTYLKEGKPPTLELAGAFARFRAWLSNIVGKITAMNVKLNPEIRDVFRRMLASDQEIADAENAQGMAPLFMTAASGRATDAEFAAYQQSVDRAQKEARNTMRSMIEDRVSRETTAWWKDESAKVQANVEAEFAQKPEYIAAEFLRTGKLPGGAELPDGLKNEAGHPLRISGKTIEAMYGPIADTVKGLIGRNALDPYGVHPDIIAQELGYGSGREMIDAIIRERPGDAAIKAEVTRRMIAAHGDILNDGTIQDRAQDVVHKVEARQRQMLAEERFLQRLVDKGGLEPSPQGEEAKREAALIRSSNKNEADKVAAARRAATSAGRIPPSNMAFMRVQAREIMGAKRVRDINPNLYLTAERRAAQRAVEAAAKGDYASALQAQRERISNFALYLEARQAQADAAGKAAIVRGWGKEPSRARLGKESPAALDQQDKFLERFDFRQGGLAADDKRQRLDAWVADQVAADLDPVIPGKMLDENFRTHWKNLNYDDLIGLHDAIASIREQAHRAATVLIRGKREDARNVIDALVAQARTLRARALGSISKESEGRVEHWATSAAGWRASLRKIEEVCLQMDGGNTDGVWHRSVFQPMADAEARAKDYAVVVLKKIHDITEAMPKEIRDNLLEKVPIPGTDVSLTRSEMLGVFLNTGSASNMERLTSAGLPHFKIWGPDVVEKIVSQLTEHEMDFAQGVWNTLQDFWPEIEAQRQRLTGIAPPQVEAKSFTRRFTAADGTVREKTYEGGYYPLVDDPRYKDAVPTSVDPNSTDLFSQAHQRALPPNSWAHERVEGYVSPLYLGLDPLPRHINAVIHDLTHREALISVRKLITDKNVRSAMRDVLGVQQTNQFMPWLQYIANHQTPPLWNGDSTTGNLLRSLRLNATMMGIGFRASVPLVHLVGFVQAMDRVPASFMGKGLQDFYLHPLESQDAIMAESGAMRHFVGSADRDISEKFDDLRGKDTVIANAQRLGLLAFEYVRKGTAFPTYLAAKAHALAPSSEGGLGMDEASAIEHAEATVRQTIGSSSAKDLAPIQKGSDAVKLATMFYSWGSTLYQRLDTLAIDTKAQTQGRGPGWGNLMARSLFVWLIPAVASSLLRGRGPDDNSDESWAHFLMTQAALYPVETIPVVRDIANAIDKGTDPTWSPAARAFETVRKTVKGAVPAWTGDEDMTKEISNFARTAGYYVGAPIDAPIRSAEYIWDIHTGDEDPKTAGEFLHGVAYGPSRK